MKSQLRGHTVDEAAAILGVCRAITYREIRYGRLLARKIGRRTVILSEDLETYLRALPPREAAPADDKAA